MASQQDLKRRIRSVRNTRKITKAMELVAGARLRRAEARIQAMRPYADRMRELMIGTARAAGSTAARLPLLEDARRRYARSAFSPSPATAVWPGRSTRRSCAGPSPSSASCAAHGQERGWLVVGKKGRSTLDVSPLRAASARGSASPTSPRYSDAAAVAHRVIELFTQARGRPGRHASTTATYSPLTQKVETIDLLPVPRRALEERGGEDPVRDRARGRLHLRAGAGGDPARGCCRRTSRRPCTARCSSRPRPSSARA